jgi:voltage-gated potassium channel
MGAGRSGRTTREMALFAISLTLVALVGISVARSANSLFMAIILSASVATAFSRWLFPGGPFFSLTFANLIAVYTCIFAFFMEEVFGEVRPAVLGIGFSLPILFFLVGCWFRRADITSVVDHPDLRSSQALYGALVWLVPVFLVGAGVFVLSSLAEPVANTNLVFIVAMLAVGLIVLAVSRSVAIFLVDAGLLFDEFFQRMSRLAVPAFAFVTFYSMLVIVFASIFSIISQFSSVAHFRVGSVVRTISFSEAIYFSIATISTVGYGDIIPVSNVSRFLASMEVICGVMLLLFGVSELLEYTREHRRDRAAKDKDVW